MISTPRLQGHFSLAERAWSPVNACVNAGRACRALGEAESQWLKTLLAELSDEQIKTLATRRRSVGTEARSACSDGPKRPPHTGDVCMASVSLP